MGCYEDPCEGQSPTLSQKKNLQGFTYVIIRRPLEWMYILLIWTSFLKSENQ